MRSSRTLSPKHLATFFQVSPHFFAGGGRPGGPEQRAIEAPLGLLPQIQHDHHRFAANAVQTSRGNGRSTPRLARFHRATPTRGEKLCTNPLKLSSSPALQRQTRVDLTISLAHQQLTPLLRHHLLRRASIGLDPLSSADKRYLRHLQLFIGKDLSRITTDDVLIFAQAKRDGIAGRINAATQQRLLRSIQKAQLPLVDQDTLLAKHRALRREVARIVPKQATPISPQDLLQFLRNCPPNMREAVAFTWRGAARVADVSNLIAQDLTGSPQNLNIAFSHKTKCARHVRGLPRQRVCDLVTKGHVKHLLRQEVCPADYGTHCPPVGPIDKPSLYLNLSTASINRLFVVAPGYKQDCFQSFTRQKGGVSSAPKR